MKKPLIDLLQFSHNRKNSFLFETDELIKIIDKFIDQDNLVNLFNHFYYAYGLPKEVTKRKFKRFIATSYIYKKSSFNNKLRLKSLPRSMLTYGALFYACFFTKKSKKSNNYQLIIDDLWSPVELARLEKLVNLFGKENVLCIARSKEVRKEFSEYNIYLKSFFKDFNKIELYKSLYKEFFSGIWIVLFASLKTRVNLFGMSLQIINSYLSYKSLFDENKANYFIQPWHYDTNPVKNYLFKNSGGLHTATIQKNIVEADLMFAYTDIDTLFSFGNSGFQRLLEYGGEIAEVFPVGSLFMEYYWFKKPSNVQIQYDILFLGINVSNALDRIDKYEGWADDYYSSFHWLVKIKKQNPSLKIGIKHHASAGAEDPIENDILKNTGITIINKNINSYFLSFSSKCVVTYGSTMGYEMMAHNVPSLFIDPGFRCVLLPDKDNDNLGSHRITSFKQFQISIEKIILNKDINNLSLEEKNNLCFESSKTSNSIFDYLKKQTKNTL